MPSHNQSGTLRLSRSVSAICIFVLATAFTAVGHASECAAVQSRDARVPQTLRLAALGRDAVQAKRVRCMVWDAVNDKCVCWSMDDGSMQGDCNPG
jgi:hypothetical protein